MTDIEPEDRRAGEAGELAAERWGPREGPPAHLVVLCHGIGADGTAMISLAPILARLLPRAAFVAPHAPDRATPEGRQWFAAEAESAVLLAAARVAAARLGRFIDAELARLSLPASGYALLGFSQGAMITLFAGLRREVPPRAVLAYSGRLLAPERLGVELRGRPPVLVLHGERDERVPARHGREAEAALRAAGVPVTALYAEGLGHTLHGPGLAAGGRFLRAALAG